MTRLDGNKLIERLPKVSGRLKANALMSDLTWFRVGGPAEVLFTPADEADLASTASSATDDDDVLPWEGSSDDEQPSESPFAKLPSLPVDLLEAVEQFKLAIIRHRSDSWAEVDQADVVKALDALKAFASL